MGSESLATEIRTTDGTIALFHAQAQIESLERQEPLGRLTSRGLSELVDHLILRAHLLGRIVDYERASALAEPFVREASADALAFLVRARTRACLHRFTEALADLDAADYLGHTGAELAAERAAVFQAVGRYDEALALRRAAVERHADFESLGGLAVLQGERGEIAEAVRLFDESRARFRGVSPFGLAQLEFQYGHLWHRERDLNRAREWYMAALQRLPVYVPAEGHLAEIDAAQGERQTAIASFRRLASASDDPEYPAQLSHLLSQVGQTDEAAAWRAKAEARYDELLARHPAAFADHAAAFWLAAGGNPQRAIPLARLNAENRPTPRAQRLLTRALAMSERGSTT